MDVLNFFRLPRKGSFVVGKWGSSFVWCGTSMRQREVAHCMCFLLLPCTFFFFDICCLVLSFYHPLTDQFYFPVLFCWIDVDRCL